MEIKLKMQNTWSFRHQIPKQGSSDENPCIKIRNTFFEVIFHRRLKGSPIVDVIYDHLGADHIFRYEKASFKTKNGYFSSTLWTLN